MRYTGSILALLTLVALAWAGSIDNSATRIYVDAGDATLSAQIAAGDTASSQYVAQVVATNVASDSYKLGGIAAASYVTNGQSGVVLTGTLTPTNTLTVTNSLQLGGVAAANYATGAVFVATGTTPSNVAGTIYIPTNSFGGGTGTGGWKVYGSFLRTLTNGQTIADNALTLANYNNEVYDPDNVASGTQIVFGVTGQVTIAASVIYDFISTPGQTFLSLNLYKNNVRYAVFGAITANNLSTTPALTGSTTFWNDAATNVWSVYLYQDTVTNATATVTVNVPIWNYVRGYIVTPQ